MRISAAILMIGAAFPAAALAEGNRISVSLAGLELNAPGLSGTAEMIGLDLEYHVTDRLELHGSYMNGSAAGAPVDTATINLRYLHPVLGPVSAGPRLDYAWGAVSGADASETLAGVGLRLDIGERSRIDPARVVSRGGFRGRGRLRARHPALRGAGGPVSGRGDPRA
jgi:hypothetical protein